MPPVSFDMRHVESDVHGSDFNVPHVAFDVPDVTLRARHVALKLRIQALLAEILEHLLAFYIDWRLRVCCRHHSQRQAP